MQLYLDCDGVLADFDRAATELLGMPPRVFEKRRGIGALWRELARHPDFYGSLPLMSDAMDLFEAVRHLDPIILTGLPRGKWAAPQKVRWAAEHFPGTRKDSVYVIGDSAHLVDPQTGEALPGLAQVPAGSVRGACPRMVGPCPACPAENANDEWEGRRRDDRREGRASRAHHTGG